MRVVPERENAVAIDLKKITKGQEERAPRVLVYGFPGVGKTRFAAGAPDPFFLDTDKGSHKYDVRRVVPETWSETTEYLAAIEDGRIKCGSVVIDSVTELEHMGHLEFFPGSNVDMWSGGYGRGDTHVTQKWRELFAQLERLWLQGKAIVLAAHTIVKKFDDPSGPGYERFEVGTRPKLAGLLKQRTDYVLFCREEVNRAVPVKGQEPAKPTTTGTRWAYTRTCPAYDAKARGTLLFPEKFLLSWDEFAAAIDGEAKRSTEMTSQIDEMLAEIGDKELEKTVRAWLRQHPDSLLESHQKIAARLESCRVSKQAIADGAGAAQVA